MNDTSTELNQGDAPLEAQARQLASRHRARRHAGKAPTLLESLPALERGLRQAYALFARTSEEEATLSGVAEWLLDNFYVVQKAIRQVGENIPAGYYRRLPKLEGTALDGYPRVYALARQIVRVSEGRIDVAFARRFVQAYQKRRPLTMGELWALPTMLRLAIVEMLAQAVADDADIGAAADPDALTAPVDLAGAGDEAVVAAAINSLRAIDAHDWDDFFEATSLVEATLRLDPANVHSRMDFDSRDRYRGVVEDLARATEEREQDVAEEAIRLARAHVTDDDGGEPSDGWSSVRAEHVGYYLVGAGRGQLEEAVGFRPALHEQARRWAYDHATLVYLGTVALATALALIGALAYARSAGGGPWSVLGTAVLAVLPASVVGVSVTNLLIMHAVPPRVLPKLDFSDGIPPTCRTMVVIPALLTSDEEVDFLVRQLELHYQGNADPEVGFALLSDFADAPEREMPEDDRLLQRARAGIERLNRKYAPQNESGAGRRPFYFFHRERLWNPREESWMGWERKRGKLVEFNRLLRGAADTSYVVKIGDLDFLPQVEYVITLDADTVFPLDSGHRLIGTLAHPLNRARFDSGLDGEDGSETGSGQRVEAGYTVLQPRTEVKPTSVTRTRFSEIFAGDAGLDLYTRAVSDIYQDLFGEGIYIGKGIYDVDAFERSLAGRVPENALLSHDLFEGVFGRAGLVTDVVLYEDYPPTYLSYAQRLHRWVRGDWQLLPWLFPRVPHAGDGTVPNTLSVIDRWKIADNLRRSLRSPALLALLVAAWVLLPGSPLVWTAGALVASGLPVVTGAVTEIARTLGVAQPGSTTRTLLARLEKEVLRWLLSIVFLPYESILMVDAVVTTLVRLAVSRRRLLQWTTAAHTVRLFGRESKIRLLWRRMRSGPVLGLIVTAALAVLRPAAFPVAALPILSWMVSPMVAARISKPLERETPPLSDQECRRLRRLARRTWLYFERFVGPDDHWLPPDHFQEDPRGTVAHRTSPTNIGLMLLSSLSAYDLGYIGLMELSLRVGDAFDTMDELARYRGHLLNWYDTRTLEPLSPRYVSTVDSGNLAACLAALSQGFEQLEQAPVLRWERWEGLCDTLGVLREVVEVAEQDERSKHAAAELRGRIDHFHRRMLAARDEPEHWPSLLQHLEEEFEVELNQELQALVEAGSAVLTTAVLRDLRLWSERVLLHLRAVRQEVEQLLPWALLLTDPPPILGSEASADLAPSIRNAWQEVTEGLRVDSRLAGVGVMCRRAQESLEDLVRLLESEHQSVDDEARPGLESQLAEAIDWCGELDQRLDSARTTASSLRVGFDDLAGRSQGYVDEMGFDFLYDVRRDVFSIGYRVDSEELDRNHYDLLASEARIASVLAIGKQDVPQRHWLHLNRPLTRVDGQVALLSWGGSMFEYLMPDLLLRRYQGTLLRQAGAAAVKHQITFARERDVPWGISESGYYRLDAQLNYQYRGFGVPGLGRKRGLGEDLVIAPYASLLAVHEDPRAVLENVDRLIEEGMLGHYGFYEAVDYTASRLPMGQDRAIVRSYMAHHQGMILTSLSNYLNGAAVVNRLHQDPRIQSVELLLQEQIPHRSPIEETLEETVAVEGPERERVDLEPWSVRPDGPVPQVHFLSNGRYGTLITAAGGGFSSYSSQRSPRADAIALTRWRADATLDCWGTWIYVQDVEGGALWSIAEQPTRAAPDDQRVRFYPHKAEFRRRHEDVSFHTEIFVVPEEDVEIRRVTLTNHGDGARRLRLASYAEVVLADQGQDRRHPAFNKMFIESEYASSVNALLFRRRPQTGEEEPLHLAHLLVTPADLGSTEVHESDRARFIGRGCTPGSPAVFGQGLDGGQWLSGTTGATLDPIMALGQEVEMAPHTTTELAYVTLVAGSREDAIALAGQYQSWPRIARALDEAHAQSEVELRNLGLEVADVRDIMRLLSALLYPHRSLRADPKTLAANRLGQSGLWRYGISGDYPILLVRISDEERVPLVRQLVRAHAHWRDRQVKVDLVILNQRDVGYAQELNDQLNQVITQMDSDDWLNQRGGIYLLRAEQMEEAERVLLQTAARVVLDAAAGSLADQVAGAFDQPAPLPAFQPAGPLVPEEPTPPVSRPDDLQFDNGFGGFSADGKEYVVYLDRGSDGAGSSGTVGTPSPWINVIANPDFGCLVSDTGLGYTWAGNSGENRLTPWRNDPVSNLPPEAVYLRDEESAEVWSPTPLPAGDGAPYLVRHGAGYSVFEHNSHGLRQRLGLAVARADPVKLISLRLENVWDRPRRLTATFFAEWVLGINRDEAQQYVVCQYDPDSTALLARNTYSPEFADRVAFTVASQEPHGLTADRTEVLGRNGTRGHPQALGRVGLASRVAPGLDPCAALQIHVDLQPGEAKHVFFLLGQGEDRDEALALIERYRRQDAFREAWEEARTWWDGLLGTVTVETPDPAMDILLNRWLLYQALSCRLWGRSAFYQSSGAFGFRDQLQDVLSLLNAAPALARDHILRAAAHQFEEGDVLHWWHPPSGRGVRTRITDDLLWLPYVVAEYVRTTGDQLILDEEIPFRTGPPLETDEEERYGHYDLTEERASLYEHCLRALEQGTTSGPHGLPLIGAGDWNDGLNRVGLGGEGESVWLGWFLRATMLRFAELCARRGDTDEAGAFRSRAEELREAIDQSAWDGKWYIRGTYDDGSPLGSSENAECKIASMAQSWAVLSGGGREDRVEQAMASVDDWLVRERDENRPGLILLFTPPFDETIRDPGYIKGYPPGIRENGGQYTHAALWAVWAHTELGHGDRAGELFRILNPVLHSDNREKAERYGVEPYVVAADVYSADQHLGRGGWTWYTGSSGWMYRLGVEAMLGLRREGEWLRVDPCIPSDWSTYRLSYRLGDAVYRIVIENPDGRNRGTSRTTVDGEEVSDGRFRLEDDGEEHEVRLVLG